VLELVARTLESATSVHAKSFAYATTVVRQVTTDRAAVSSLAEWPLATYALPAPTRKGGDGGRGAHRTLASSAFCTAEASSGPRSSGRDEARTPGGSHDELPELWKMMGRRQEHRLDVRRVGHFVTWMRCIVPLIADCLRDANRSFQSVLFVLGGPSLTTRPGICDDLDGLTRMQSAQVLLPMRRPEVSRPARRLGRRLQFVREFLRLFRVRPDCRESPRRDDRPHWRRDYEFGAERDAYRPSQPYFGEGLKRLPAIFRQLYGNRGSAILSKNYYLTCLHISSAEPESRFALGCAWWRVREPATVAC
jgi:hypothetical protein